MDKKKKGAIKKSTPKISPYNHTEVNTYVDDFKKNLDGLTGVIESAPEGEARTQAKRWASETLFSAGKMFFALGLNTAASV